MIFAVKRQPYEDRLESYHKNGFWLERGVFSEDRIEAIKEEMREIFLRRLKTLQGEPTNPQDLFLTMRDLFRHSLPSYLASAKLTQYLPSLARLSVCEEVMDLVKRFQIELPVISTRSVCHFVSDDLVIEGGYNKTPPHQDWRSIQGSLDSIIVWIPFCDIDASFFPLEVIPGSHLRGLLPTEEDPFGHRIRPGFFEEEDFRVLEMKKGDCLLFSTLLVHRTSHRGRPGVRIATSFRFNNLADETFVERDYPNTYFYRPDMTLITPGFPTPLDVKKVFKNAM